MANPSHTGVERNKKTTRGAKMITATPRLILHEILHNAKMDDMMEFFLIREKLYRLGKGQWAAPLRHIQRICDTTQIAAKQALDQLQQGGYITVQNLPYKWLLITIIAMPDCMAQPRETILAASMVSGTETVQ
jgi:hypothetical protein